MVGYVDFIVLLEEILDPMRAAIKLNGPVKLPFAGFDGRTVRMHI